MTNPFLDDKFRSAKDFYSPEELMNLNLSLEALGIETAEDQVVYAALTHTHNTIETMGTMVVESDVVNDTVTPVNITGLSFPVEAYTKYGFRFYLKHHTPAAATAIRYQLTGPASPTRVQITARYWTTGPIAVAEEMTAFSTPTTNPTTATQLDDAIIEGFICNGINAGTVQVQFESETAGQECTVYYGSWGTWHKLN